MCVGDRVPRDILHWCPCTLIKNSDHIPNTKCGSTIQALSYYIHTWLCGQSYYRQVFVCVVCIPISHIPTLCVHIQLQHYYEVLAEKLSADIAQTVVWEGAAKNAKIKISLNDVVDDDGGLVCMKTFSLRYFLLAPVIIQGQGKHSLSS